LSSERFGIRSLLSLEVEERKESKTSFAIYTRVKSAAVRSRAVVISLNMLKPVVGKFYYYSIPEPR
jgi:hypothetical protein